MRTPIRIALAAGWLVVASIATFAAGSVSASSGPAAPMSFATCVISAWIGLGVPSCPSTAPW